MVLTWTPVPSSCAATATPGSSTEGSCWSSVADDEQDAIASDAGTINAAVTNWRNAFMCLFSWGSEQDERVDITHWTLMGSRVVSQKRLPSLLCALDLKDSKAALSIIT